MKQSNRGKGVIVGIFLLALVLSGYAWWHQFQQGPRCRDFLGTEAVQLVRLAPRVELLRFDQDLASAEGSPAPEDVLQIAGTTLHVTRRANITKVPGLLHARHALLQDVNYQWDAAATPCLSQWSFGLRFSNNGEDVIVAFDPQCNRIGLKGAADTAPFIPELMSTFATKSVEWETRAGGQ